MNDKWSYINFNTLIKETLDGNRCIQEPITVYNVSGEKAKNLNFETHLLCYENIHKENLLEILHKIYMMFNTKIDKLNNNENIKFMVKQINNEWFRDNERLQLKDPLSPDFFDTCKKSKRAYEKSKKKYDEIIELSEYEKDIPIDSKLREDYPMERELEGAILLCDKSLEKIKENAEELKVIIQNIKDNNTSTIMDLSTKHKHLYYNNNSSEDQSIPSNIHKIFSNYLHIHTLFLKQIIIYYNNTIDLIKDMEKKCSELTILKQNVNIIAHLNSDDNDIFDYVLNGIKNIFSSEENKEEQEEQEEQNNVDFLIEDYGEDEDDEGDEDYEESINNSENNLNNGKLISNKIKQFF